MERCGYAAAKNAVRLRCVFDGFRPLGLSDLAVVQVHEGECRLRCDQCCIVWRARDEAWAKAEFAKPLPITGRALLPRATEVIVGSVR